MKRCNNCGWFNLDSATHCEKCDEESFEIVEPEPEPEQLPEPASAPVKSGMMATVAFGVSTPDERPRKSLAATVMDASAVMDAESVSQCPKCNYPISGYVEYCPNCGVTIRRAQMPEAPEMQVAPAPEVKISLASTVMINEPVSAKSHVAAVTVCESDLKATVRDIPSDLVQDDDTDVFWLVPMSAIGEAPVELKLGSVVYIGGKGYTFRK